MLQTAPWRHQHTLSQVCRSSWLSRIFPWQAHSKRSWKCCCWKAQSLATCLSPGLTMTSSRQLLRLQDHLQNCPTEDLYQVRFLLSQPGPTFGQWHSQRLLGTEQHIWSANASHLVLFGTAITLAASCLIAQLNVWVPLDYAAAFWQSNVTKSDI